MTVQNERRETHSLMQTKQVHKELEWGFISPGEALLILDLGASVFCINAFDTKLNDL